MFAITEQTVCKRGWFSRFGAHTTCLLRVRAWLGISALFACLLVSTPGHAEVTGVQGDQLQTLMDEGVAVIDVRRPDEWKSTGVLKNSHLLTFFDSQGRYDVEQWLADLAKIVDKDEPFVIICAVGGRTGTISKFLDGKLGMQGVHDATGGIRHWIKSGREVVTAAQPE